MKNIWTIVKKELKRFFTDRRMLLSLILPGVLIFVIYSVMGNFISDSFTAKKDHTYIVYVQNQPEQFSTISQIDYYDIEVHTVIDEDIDNIKQQIQDKNADLLVIYEDDFYNKMMAYDASTHQKAPQIQMFYNSVSNESMNIYNYYTTALDAIESSLSNKFDINNNQEINFDVAPNDEKSTQIIKMFLPFLLTILLFTGCMNIATESIAGEKERGTIATLLITPVKRSELAIGKIIALSITSMVSALSSFIGIMASLPKLFAGTGVSISVYGFGTYMAILAIIIVTILLFTVALSIVSTFAKSVKEASQLALPIMMVVMLLGITSFISTSAATNTALYFIPVYNSIQCMIAIFDLAFNPLNFLITIIVNILAISLGVYVLTRMFRNEKVMFNK